jgi:hypothetical protein
VGWTYAGAAINSTAVANANGGSDPSAATNAQKKNSIFYSS